MTTEPMMTRIALRSGLARPVTRPDDRQVWSWSRESDVRSALTRGLAEYLTQLEIAATGKAFGFKRVVETFADLEQRVEFPGAAVYALGPGTYDSTALAPKTFYLDDGTRRALRLTAEYRLDAAIDFWTNDQHERAVLMAMLEDALEPVDFMSGVRIELPFYHNARATFERISSSYEDSPPDVQRRIWKGSMTVSATTTVVRRAGEIPTLKPRLDLVEVSSTADVD